MNQLPMSRDPESGDMMGDPVAGKRWPLTTWHSIKAELGDRGWRELQLTHCVKGE